MKDVESGVRLNTVVASLTPSSMEANKESTIALLEATYSALDLRAGDFLAATDSHKEVSSKDWIEKGGWLTLAKKVGVERVFFVQDNPVAVFARLEDPNGDWQAIYNQIWCMARPPLLFLAMPGELLVLDLTQPPARKGETIASHPGRVCEIIRKVQDVQLLLQKYHRAQLESGKLFEERHFGSENRADRALIRDLGKVRKALINDDLDVEAAHALIGRSIFVRYLEDRGVLTEPFYRELAGPNKTWNGILNDAPAEPGKERRLYYTAILQNKSFTDALFDRLARDFNGDLFPFVAEEKRAFTQKRLQIIRSFLLGEIDDKSLFFFAYDFEIIPIELISSIYEEFLKVEKGKENTQGSFYTPPALVEFVLAGVLTPEVMNTRPRILDPACGSAIFLVESFRRLVRHRVAEEGRRLRKPELQKILREQIAGIDVNPEAIRVATFSLYLALLHYLDPPDILSHQLPALTYKEGSSADIPGRFDILLPLNAFELDDGISDGAVKRRFASKSIDVIVGNPPWGQPQEQDEVTRRAAKEIEAWCKRKHRTIGDRELSQAFVHLTLDLLKEGGVAGLLVSTGVFFKRHEKSREFRKQWFSEAALKQVVNFAAARHVFFTGIGHVKGAIAPFASILFESRHPVEAGQQFDYFSAKETAIVDRLQVVVLKKPDLHRVRQRDFAADDDLWKVFWWGGHRDKALLHALRMETTLAEIVDPKNEHPERIGEGFKESKKNKKKPKNLLRYRELPTSSFTRYGPLKRQRLIDPPAGVERERSPVIYSGCRLLIKRGITQRMGLYGQIVARLETLPFCFRHSIYGIRLTELAQDQAEVLLGIIWSSVTRYFAWITAGSWGTWHHEILKETIARLPIRLPTNPRLRKRITRIVQELRSSNAFQGHLFADAMSEDSPTTIIQGLERELDNAVFDLFDLSGADRELVREMCDIGLPYFYGGRQSIAAKPLVLRSQPFAGTAKDVGSESNDDNFIFGYLRAFLEIWDRELAPDGYFSWRVICPSSAPMVAVIFTTESKYNPSPANDSTDDEEWSGILKELSDSTRQATASSRIYVDGMARIVGPNEIIIIKQNELRLWTRTMAREDAEATLLQTQRRQLTGLRGNA